MLLRILFFCLLSCKTPETKMVSLREFKSSNQNILAKNIHDFSSAEIYLDLGSHEETFQYLEYFVCPKGKPCSPSPQNPGLSYEKTFHLYSLPQGASLIGLRPCFKEENTPWGNSSFCSSWQTSWFWENSSDPKKMKDILLLREQLLTQLGKECLELQREIKTFFQNRNFDTSSIQSRLKVISANSSLRQENSDSLSQCANFYLSGTAENVAKEIENQAKNEQISFLSFSHSSFHLSALSLSALILGTGLTLFGTLSALHESKILFKQKSSPNTQISKSQKIKALAPSLAITTLGILSIITSTLSLASEKLTSFPWEGKVQEIQKIQKSWETLPTNIQDLPY